MLNKLTYICNGQSREWLLLRYNFEKNCIRLGVVKLRSVLSYTKKGFIYYILLGLLVFIKDRERFILFKKVIKLFFILVIYSLLRFFGNKWEIVREYVVRIFPDLSLYTYANSYKPFAFILSSILVVLLFIVMSIMFVKVRELLRPYISYLFMLYLLCLYNICQQCYVVSIGGQSIWWKPEWYSNEDYISGGYIDYLPEWWLQTLVYGGEYIINIEEILLFILISLRYTVLN